MQLLKATLRSLMPNLLGALIAAIVITGVVRLFAHVDFVFWAACIFIVLAAAYMGYYILFHFRCQSHARRLGVSYLDVREAIFTYKLPYADFGDTKTFHQRLAQAKANH